MATWRVSKDFARRRLSADQPLRSPPCSHHSRRSNGLSRHAVRLFGGRRDTIVRVVRTDRLFLKATWLAVKQPALPGAVDFADDARRTEVVAWRMTCMMCPDTVCGQRLRDP